MDNPYKDDRRARFERKKKNRNKRRKKHKQKHDSYQADNHNHLGVFREFTYEDEEWK